MQWNFIAKQAKAIKSSWTNKDRVRFHYFNPNGVYAKKLVIDTIVMDLVEKGKCKSGALYVHGSLNSYHATELRLLIDAKRISNFDATYHVEQIEKENEKALKFIADTLAA